MESTPKEVKVQCFLHGAERTVHLLPDLSGQYFSQQLLLSTFGISGGLLVYCSRGRKVSWLVMKEQLAVWLSPTESYFVVGKLDPLRTGYQRVIRGAEKMQQPNTNSERTVTELSKFSASLDDILFYKQHQEYPEALLEWAKGKGRDRVESVKRAFRLRASRFGYEHSSSGKNHLVKYVVGDDGRLCSLPVLTTDDEIVSALRRVHDKDHCSRPETIRRLKQLYCIVGVREIVDKWIKTCPSCSVSSYQKAPRMQTYLLMDEPFERVRGSERFDEAQSHFALQIQYDLTFWERDLDTGDEYLFLAVDHFTKLAFGASVHSKSADDVSKVIKAMLDALPVKPKSAQSDNGGEFRNRIVEEILSRHQIEVVHGKPFHSQSNGGVERGNKTLCSSVRALWLQYCE